MNGQATHGGTYINTSCQKCGGKGSWTTEEKHTFGGVTTFHVCDACNGTGWYWQLSNGPVWTPPFKPDQDTGLSLLELNGKIARLQDENDKLRVALQHVNERFDDVWKHIGDLAILIEKQRQMLEGKISARVQGDELVVQTEGGTQRYKLKDPTP